MTQKGQTTAQENRIYFLDNLRTFMIFLVVMLHAGVVYESSGWSANIWLVDDPSVNDLSGSLNLVMDIFVMATIFFVSGFFTPLSLKNKNEVIFLKSKFKRLVIPWIIAVFTLIPLYKAIFLYSRDLPQESWTTYFHFNYGISGQNWLWFLPVLFLFDVLYLIFSKINIKLPKISLSAAVFAVFVIGLAYSLFMDFFKLQGWTHTVLIDFQHERLLIYFLIFLLGSLCYKLKVFESKRKNRILYFTVSFLVWVPIFIYFIFFLYPLFIKPGSYIFSKPAHTLILWGSFHISLFSMLYLMVNTFRYYFNKQGEIGKVLNQSSYSVYIIHMIVIGVIALTMLHAEIPSLLKYLILTVSAYITSNLIVYFYRTVKAKI